MLKKNFTFASGDSLRIYRVVSNLFIFLRKKQKKNDRFTQWSERRRDEPDGNGSATDGRGGEHTSETARRLRQPGTTDALSERVQSGRVSNGTRI